MILIENIVVILIKDIIVILIEDTVILIEDINVIQWTSQVVYDKGNNLCKKKNHSSIRPNPNPILITYPIPNSIPNPNPNPTLLCQLINSKKIQGTAQLN